MPPTSRGDGGKWGTCSEAGATDGPGVYSRREWEEVMGGGGFGRG